MDTTTGRRDTTKTRFNIEHLSPEASGHMLVVNFCSPFDIFQNELPHRRVQLDHFFEHVGVFVSRCHGLRAHHQLFRTNENIIEGKRVELKPTNASRTTIAHARGGRGPYARILKSIKRCD